MESWVDPLTSGKSLFTHLKEIDKWRIHSQQLIRLNEQGEVTPEGMEYHMVVLQKTHLL